MKRTLPPLPVSVSYARKKCILLLLALCGCLLNVAHAQIINEGFEETEWQTQTTATASGKVTITSTTASSTVTYYNNTANSSTTFTTNGPFAPNASYATFTASTTTTGGNSTRTTYGVNLTNTAVNTCPNSGTWWYSKAQTSSDDRLRRAHSVSRSMQLGTSGYIITPVTQSAFVSVTFWANLAVPMVVGINTNTDATQASFNSSTTSTALNAAGFTYASQTFAASATMTSYSYTGFFSAPAKDRLLQHWWLQHLCGRYCCNATQRNTACCKYGFRNRHRA